MRIIVTGGNSGVGKAAASTLAAAGHSVIIACRTIPKGERAAAQMSGDVEVRHLDLADLGSIRAFADSVEAVDILVNNAGVLGLPLTRTADGFEAHLGTNHLGHFALTCRLGDKIADRVISVSSAIYMFGRIDFSDLNWRARDYSMWAAYGQSKLANMLFVDELARRGVRAYACDPGIADTEVTRDSSGVLRWMGKNMFGYVGQSASAGARATVQAVTTRLPTGTYLAPRFIVRGKPKVTAPLEKAHDPVIAKRLWELSAELTGCDWQGHPSGQANASGL